MRNCLWLTCLFSALALPAGAAEPAPVQPKNATSKVIHVTVYPNSALVTREVEVPEGSGIIELVVTPLPPQTVHSSLYSEGTNGTRVLTTRFRTRAVKEDTREEVRKLQDQLKTLQQTCQRIQADIKTAEQNLAMLAKLETFTSANTQHATEKGTLNGETIITLSKYVMDMRGEKTKEVVSLQQQLQDKNEQTEFIQRQLRELAAGSSKTEQDAVIVIDKTNKDPGKLRLNYLVDAASWQPQYKLRAGEGEKDPVQVEYLAAVMQHTGEDWTNINMTLSTAQPMLNAAPPDLKILAVHVTGRGGAPQVAANAVPNPPGQSLAANQPYQPVPAFNAPGGMPPPAGQNEEIQQFAEQVKGLRKQAQADINDNKKQIIGNQLYNQAAAFEQSWELTNFDVRVVKGEKSSGGSGNEGPSVTYHLPTKLSIPSRNDEQVIEVTKLDMAPEYYYKAVPVLTSHVYRLATLTNKSKHVLLPGEATMYLGSDFVGRMNLPLVAIGEQFTAGFGVDPQLQVHRQMTDKSRTAQGGNQVLKYEYRILVSSYKAEPVRLQVWDRLPRAEAETLAVTLVKATPDTSADPLYQREQKPNNLLRWDLKLDPTMNGEKALAVNYEFKLELDKQSTIGSFLTR